MSISFQLSAPKKRKSPVAAAFEGKQVDDEAVAAVAKRPALLLEDNVAKSKRLQDAGYILVEAEKYAAAIELWEQAIELTPHRAVLYELKAQVLMELGEYFAAISAATTATTLDDKWHEGYLTLARAQVNFGELDLAIETLKKAISIPHPPEDTWRELNAEFERVVNLLVERDKLEVTSQVVRVTQSDS